ncbi:MAG: hypothetical protein NTZ68_00290 [Candidatus Dependentiae bacterium]|nr:hypothetical protein [Candidatus Dependentiae bacterium]
MFLMYKKEILLLGLSCCVYQGEQNASWAARRHATTGLPDFHAISKAREAALKNFKTPAISTASKAGLPSSTVTALSSPATQLAKFNTGFIDEMQTMPANAMVSLLPVSDFTNQQVVQQAITKLFQDVYTVEDFLYHQSFFTRMVSNLNNLRTNKLIPATPASDKLLEGLARATAPATPAKLVVPSGDQIVRYLAYVQNTQAEAIGLLPFGASSKPLISVDLPEQQLFLTAGLVGSDMFTEALLNYEEIKASLADVYEKSGIIAGDNLNQKAKEVEKFFKEKGIHIQKYTEEIITYLILNPNETLVSLLNGDVKAIASVKAFIDSAKPDFSKVPKSLKNRAEQLYARNAKLHVLAVSKYVVGAYESLAVEVAKLGARGEYNDAGVAGADSGAGESTMSFDIPTDWANYLKFLLGLSAGIVAADATGKWSDARFKAQQEMANRDALQAAFQLEFAKQQQEIALAEIQGARDKEAAIVAVQKKAEEEDKSVEQVEEEQKEKAEAIQLPTLTSSDVEKLEQFLVALKIVLAASGSIEALQILAFIELQTTFAYQVYSNQYGDKEMFNNLLAYSATRSGSISKILFNYLDKLKLPAFPDLTANDYAKFIQDLQKDLATRSDLFIGSEYDSLKNLPELKMKNRQAIADEVVKYFVSVPQEYMKLAAKVVTIVKLKSINFAQSATEIIKNVHDLVEKQDPGLAKQLELQNLSSIDQLYLIGYCKQQFDRQPAPDKSKKILAKDAQKQLLALEAMVVASDAGSKLSETPTKKVSFVIADSMEGSKVQAVLDQLKKANPSIPQPSKADVAELAQTLVENEAEIKAVVVEVKREQELNPNLSTEKAVGQSPAAQTLQPTFAESVVNVLQFFETIIPTESSVVVTPPAVKEAIEEFWQEEKVKGKQWKKVVGISQEFKTACKKYAVTLAQTILNAGKNIVTSQDLKAALNQKNITILGLSNSNNMAYLMGYVQMKVWMLQANAPQESRPAASVWPVIELVSSLRS